MITLNKKNVTARQFLNALQRVEYNYTCVDLAKLAALGEHLEGKARFEPTLLGFFAHLDTQNQAKLADAITALATERGYI